MYVGHIIATVSGYLPYMRIQLYIIAVLVSLIMWCGVVHLMRDTYTIAQNSGFIQNLHFKTLIRHSLGAFI